MPNASNPMPADEPMIVTPLCSIFRRFLKKQGLKFTTERAMILDAVLAKEGVFEVDELMFEMHRDGQRVSKATIYRTIKHLVEAGIIKEILFDSKQAHYQLVYGREPVDHLVDMDTEQIIEFFDEELIALRDRICEKHGMKAVSHRFLIYAVKTD